MSIKWKGAIAALGLACLAGGTAQAAVSVSGCGADNVCTLSELYGGGSITVDDVLFDGFAFVFEDGGVDADSIVVSGSTVGGEVQLSFEADPEISSEFFEYAFAYDVAVTSARVITDVTIALESVAISGDSFVEYFHEVDGNLLETFFDPFDFALVDSVSVGNLSSLMIAADFNGESFDGGLASLRAFNARFALAGEPPAPEVPLPGAFALMGTAIGLGALKRRRSQS